MIRVYDDAGKVFETQQQDLHISASADDELGEGVLWE